MKAYIPSPTSGTKATRTRYAIFDSSALLHAHPGWRITSAAPAIIEITMMAAANSIENMLGPASSPLIATASCRADGTTCRRSPGVPGSPGVRFLRCCGYCDAGRCVLRVLPVVRVDEWVLEMGIIGAAVALQPSLLVLITTHRVVKGFQRKSREAGTGPSSRGSNRSATRVVEPSARSIRPRTTRAGQARPPIATGPRRRGSRPR